MDKTSGYGDIGMPDHGDTMPDHGDTMPDSRLLAMAEKEPHPDAAESAYYGGGGLEGLAFNDASGQPVVTRTSTPKPMAPTREGEGNTIRGYASEFETHKFRERRPRVSRPPKKPPLLSPEEQQDMLAQRRANLGNKPLATQSIKISIGAADYSRLLAMAEKEQMAGALAQNFTFYIAWCMKIGLRYYETAGFTHMNPDRIVFSEEDREKPLAPPAQMRLALERSVTPVAPVHPILGRGAQPYPTSLEESYGDMMSPNPTIADMNLEYKYLQAHRDKMRYEHAPAILQGRPAFDSSILRSSMRALLPASKISSIEIERTSSEAAFDG